MLPFIISLSLPLGQRVTSPAGGVRAAAVGGEVGVKAVVDGALAAGGDLVRIHLCPCSYEGRVVGLGFQLSSRHETTEQFHKHEHASIQV